MTSGTVFLVVGFFIAATIFSLFVVRAAHFLVAKLLTCHPTRQHLLDEGRNGDDLTAGTDYEPMFRKIGLLYIYNFTVVITITGFLFLYTNSPLGETFEAGLDIWLAVLLVSLVMVFSLRVSSLGDMRLETPFYKDMVHRSLGFGYAFILTIYFLTLFGLSTYVIQSGAEVTLSSDVTVSTTDAGLFTVLLFVGPLIAAFCSELLLDPRLLGVREYDPLHRRRSH